MKEKLNISNMKAHLPLILTITKYSFSLILTILSCLHIRNSHYFFAGLLELIIIFLFSNILLQKKLLAWIVNDILLFLYNAQMMVMFFANSYVTMVMMTNLDSIEALSGKMGAYLTGTILVLIFSLFPIKQISFKKLNIHSLLSFALCLELLFTFIFGNSFSPIYGYLDLGIQHYDNMKYNEAIKNAALLSDTEISDAFNGMGENISSGSQLTYYSENIEDHREKISTLPEQPNVILIFTEGLSQSILSDERGIMQNLSNLQRASLSFENYYNHTFATYRGIIGQLYSGYQLKNSDTNSLISLQSIFSDQGYQTTFINTEPENPEFSEHLESFGYDQVVGKDATEYNGVSGSISDKDAYQLLFDLSKEQASTEQPFFITMYTFGTHISFDSPDEIYNDGKSPELNKFYNLDQQFQSFFSQFMDSPISDNTILVFTTDHATFVDESYDSNFPLAPRAVGSIDEIPLFIFHKDITPETIDVNGRNSLGLAPTLMDYLDISVPNYFLGTSLFADKESSSLETTYSDSYVYASTKGDIITELTERGNDDFRRMQQEYFITNELVSKTSK